MNKVHTLDDTTRHRLKNDLYADSDVQFYWCLTVITLKIDNLKAEELLELCMGICPRELIRKFNTRVLQATN